MDYPYYSGGASKSSSTASSSRKQVPEMYPDDESPDNNGVGTRSCLAFRLPTKKQTASQSQSSKRGSSKTSSQSSDKMGLLESGSSYGWESFQPHNGNGNGNIHGDSSDAFASPPARQQHSAMWDVSQTPSSWDAGTAATGASSVSPSRSSRTPLDRGTGTSKGTASTAGMDTAASSVNNSYHSNTNSNSLLTPPAPSDRSQQRRLRYERENRGGESRGGQQRGPVAGVAASEMEPAGVRGQQAPYVPAPTSARSAVATTPRRPSSGDHGIHNTSRLLTPPAPTDRSERRRLQYEQEKRRAADPMGGTTGTGGAGMYNNGNNNNNNNNHNVYNRDMEPVGVRGQSAPLPPHSQQSQQSQQSQAQSQAQPNLGGLLTPPQPSDRRDQRRRRYENEQQQQQNEPPLSQQRAPQHQSSANNHMPLRLAEQQMTPTSRTTGMASSPYSAAASAATVSTPTHPLAVTRMDSTDTSDSSNSDDELQNMRDDLMPMDEQEYDEHDNNDEQDDEQEYEQEHAPNGTHRNDLIQFSPISGQAVRVPVISQSPGQGQGQPGQGQQVRSRAPPPARMVSSESTVSDEDIQYMRPDLQPSFTPTAELPPTPTATATTLRTPQRQQQAFQNDQYQQYEQPQQQQRRGQEQQSGLATISPVAAAAAAAAASAAPSRFRGDELDDRAREIETASVDTLNAQAMQHVQAGEFDMALQLFARVLAIHQKRDGQVHPTVASSYHNLGTVHAKRAALTMEDSMQQQHCRAQALECFQAAARVARDSLGRNHPNVAVSLVRIGFLLLQSRQYQNAIITFKEALRIRLAHYGAQHGLVANLYNNLGVCHMHLGHFGEGREFLDSGLGIQRHIANETKDQKKNDRWINLLELADTLFNIGGLCLEWIRRQGPDARRAVDAENAFAEAFEVRTFCLNG
jgi:tetratricopeptide (TPR) repeat protein